MKRILTFAVVLLLICSMLPLGSLAETETVVRITHYRKVNVRSGPSSSYRVLGEVSPDDTFPYLGTQNGWHCIQYTASKTGYVYGEMSTVETVVYDPWDEYESDGACMVYISNRNPVNVRSGPSSSYRTIASVQPRTWHPYLGSKGDWHCIELDDGRIGYVYEELCTLDGERWEGFAY